VQKSIHTVQHAQLRVLLREARQEAGLTQIQLAERLDIPQAVVSNVERGERRLDLVELCEYCEAVGVDLSEFVVKFQQRCGRAGRLPPEKLQE
jgi:transcriptional regulator with XRE-family HTH domain